MSGLSGLVTQLFAISKLDDRNDELNFKLQSTCMSENWKLLFPCFASCERSLCHDRFKSNSWTCLAEKLKQPFALILRFRYCKADRYRVPLRMWKFDTLLEGVIWTLWIFQNYSTFFKCQGPSLLSLAFWNIHSYHRLQGNGANDKIVLKYWIAFKMDTLTLTILKGRFHLYEKSTYAFNNGRIYRTMQDGT